MKTKKVKRYAIQGFAGSFHAQAAAEYFVNSTCELLYCNTFTQTFTEGVNKNNDGAVVAIENSIAGSILPNYTLLQQSKLHIVGEIYLQINQHLLVNAGVRYTDIKEVHSHPMALLQCSKFLQKYHYKLVETDDTALSAKYIKNHHCTHIAAIAGSQAAKEYGLHILQENIHTLPNNLTRFLILHKTANKPNSKHNKASLHFKTDHTQGALAKVLGNIASEGINLSNLQSYPVAGSNFNYYFYADIEFENITMLEKINAKLAITTHDYTLLGVYKAGNIPNLITNTHD